MIVGSFSVTPAARTLPARRIWLSVALITSLAAKAAAQQPAPKAAEPAAPAQYIVSAGERFLWVAEVRGQRSILYARGLFKPFGVGRLISRPIAMMAAADEMVYVLFADDSLHRFYLDGDTPERNLPFKERPLHLAAGDNRLFAIVTARASLGMTTQPAVESAEAPAGSGELSLSLAQYDGVNWSPLTPCPPGVTESAAPRLLLVERGLLLCWMAPDSGKVETRRWDFDQRAWSDWGHVDAPNAGAYFSVLLSPTPHILTVPRGSGSSLAAFRRLADDWRPIDLKLSPLPAGVQLKAYRDALTFGQRLGVLTIDANDQAYLQFTQAAEGQGEGTIKLSEALNLDSSSPLGQLKQVILVVLIGVLASVFVFRRESIFLPIALPAGWQLANTSQRLVAWLIDYLPFTIAASITLDVSWVESVSATLNWAFHTELTDDKLPAREILLWWGLGSGGHVVYALVMELLTRRTVGKVLMRIHVIRARGHSPIVGVTAAAIGAAGMDTDGGSTTEDGTAVPGSAAPTDADRQPAAGADRLPAVGEDRAGTARADRPEARGAGPSIAGVPLSGASPAGASPGSLVQTARQALVRNLARSLELFPPYWPLAFLVLLTRNRQRLGDIYAGTVVVRQVVQSEIQLKREADRRARQDKSEAGDGQD